MPTSHRSEMYEKLRTKSITPLISYSYTYVTLFTLFIQAAGLIAAYLLGISLHYNRLIRTHCVVPNFWPSISKVTGDHLPERYIWRLAIAFTTFPRAMDAILYYNFFACRRAQLFERSWWYRWLNRLNMTFLIVELLLFYTVTLISSKENFMVHLYAWIAFLAISMLYMVSFLILYGAPCTNTPLTSRERTSLKIRSGLLCMEVVAVIVFLYFGTMHIFYCWPYAFTIAAIFECIIAACDLTFQAVQLYDFASMKTFHIWDDENLKLI